MGKAHLGGVVARVHDRKAQGFFSHGSFDVGILGRGKIVGNDIIRGIKEIDKASKEKLFLALPFIGYAVATFFVNLSGGRTVWIIFAFANYIYIFNKRKNYEKNIGLRSC